MTRVVNIAQSGGNNVTMRNRIINGGMMIDQRNAGASITVSTDFTYCVDRFNGSRGGSTNNFTMQQSTTAPAGFKNSLLYTMGTGVSVGTTNYAVTAQAIEGLNVADLMLGSASSAAFTLSFWVRSSVTGTFGVVFRNSASNASYCSTYTITSANTFEYKTVTVPAGAINSGTWLTTNGIGMNVIWDLGVGSAYSAAANQLTTGGNYFGVTGTTKLSETTGATFYITGVQLEAGTTATPFEQRLYGTELYLCQRYFWPFIFGDSAGQTPGPVGWGESTTTILTPVQFPQTMRSAPSISTTNAAADFRVRYGGASIACNAVPSGVNINTMACWLFGYVSSGITVNSIYALSGNNSNVKLNFSAEL